MVTVVPGLRPIMREQKNAGFLVRSEQVTQREQYTLNKTLAMSTALSQKSFRKLCKQRFVGELDAVQTLADWESAQSYISDSDGRVICQAVFKKSGRPKINQQPDSYY